jgi:hypothetical protein
LRERPALPDDGEGPSRVLVLEGGEPHTWGGPRIRWAERQNLESVFFVLDNKEEVRDWGTIQSGAGLAVRSLTTALDSLRDIIFPVSQV